MLHEVPVHEAPGRLESFNPRDGSKLGEVPVADAAMVQAVFDRARRAQVGWAEMGVDRRNEILNRLRGVLLDRADEIARTVSSENGKPPVEPIGLIPPVCEAIARQLRTGSVMVNNALQSGGCVTLPFGGDGHSGIGRVDKRGFLQKRRRVVQWPRHGGAGQRAQIASVLGTVWHILAYQ